MPDWVVPLIAAIASAIAVVLAAPGVRTKIAANTAARAAVKSETGQENSFWALLQDKIARLEQQIREQEAAFRAKTADLESRLKAQENVSAQLEAAKAASNQTIMELRAQITAMWRMIDKDHGEELRALPLTESGEFRKWLFEHFTAEQLVVVAADSGLPNINTNAPLENIIKDLVDEAFRQGSTGILMEIVKAKRPNVPLWPHGGSR